MDSYVAEWNVELTDVEIRRLRRGVPPFDVRPNNMVQYHKCEESFFRNVTRNTEGKKNSEIVFIAPSLPSPRDLPPLKEKTER